MADDELQVCRRYFPGGQLMTEWTERNGQLHGWRRHWFADGRLFSEAEYNNGLPHGVIREWTEDGQLTLSATRVNGQLDGHYQSWWDDGIRKEDGMYVRGVRQPGYSWFRPNGELWRELGRD